MKTIKEQAVSYVAAQTKNIADLKMVSVDVVTTEKLYKEGTTDAFTVNVLEYEGEDYRVPNIVLKQLQTLLIEKPDMKYFKVKKSGSGMSGTTYLVMEVKTE